MSGGKCIWNIKPEISNLSEDATIIGDIADIVFCDIFCIVIREIKV
jgi:hypothetical protein